MLNSPQALAVTTSSPAVDRDFNGDGKTDILWRDTSGAVSVWFMNGTSVIGTGSLGAVGTNWQIQ